MKLNRHGLLQLNVPYRTDRSTVEDFIIAKYDWILSNKKNRKSQNDFIPLSYHDGAMHFYLGVQYPLQFISSKQSRVELKNNTIYVFHRKGVSIKNLLDKWYKQQALVYLNRRTVLFMNNYQLPHVNKVNIRSMKARWGSCNARAEITYNTHLIKAHVESIDYVIIHELCHLIHPNHGKGFYQLQSKLNPLWEKQKLTLDQQGYQFIK